MGRGGDFCSLGNATLYQVATFQPQPLPLCATFAFFAPLRLIPLPKKHFLFSLRNEHTSVRVCKQAHYQSRFIILFSASLFREQSFPLIRPAELSSLKIGLIPLKLGISLLINLRPNSSLDSLSLPDRLSTGGSFVLIVISCSKA